MYELANFFTVFIRIYIFCKNLKKKLIPKNKAKIIQHYSKVGIFTSWPENCFNIRDYILFMGISEQVSLDILGYYVPTKVSISKSKTSILIIKLAKI